VERKRQASDETRAMICTSAHYIAKAQ